MPIPREDQKASARTDAETRASGAGRRTTSEVREAIDAASTPAGAPLTEFRTETTTQGAPNGPEDERVLLLTEAELRTFVDLLANPPVPNETLRELFRKAAPWET